MTAHDAVDSEGSPAPIFKYLGLCSTTGDMTLEENCIDEWTMKTTEQECVVSGYCMTYDDEVPAMLEDVASVEECAALGSCMVEESTGSVAEAAQECTDQVECEALGYCAHSLGSCSTNDAVTLEERCDGDWSPLEFNKEECEALGRVERSEVPDFSRAASASPRVQDAEDSEIVVQR